MIVGKGICILFMKMHDSWWIRITYFWLVYLLLLINLNIYTFYDCSCFPIAIVQKTKLSHFLWFPNPFYLFHIRMAVSWLLCCCVVFEFKYQRTALRFTWKYTRMDTSAQVIFKRARAPWDARIQPHRRCGRVNLRTFRHVHTHTTHYIMRVCV